MRNVLLLAAIFGRSGRLAKKWNLLESENSVSPTHDLVACKKIRS